MSLKTVLNKYFLGAKVTKFVPAKDLPKLIGDFKIQNFITATSTSTTTDFASLEVNDIVFVGGAFAKVITKGTSPSAPAIGDVIPVFKEVK